LTRGVTASSPTGFPPLHPQPSLRAVAQHLTGCTTLPEAQFAVFSRETWQRDLTPLKIGRSQEF
jgi:hypothetical protein